MKKILSYLAASMLFLSLIVTTGCEDETGGGTTVKLEPSLRLNSASDVVDGGLLDRDISGTVFLALDGSIGDDNLETLTFKENGSNMDASRISEANGSIGSAVALLTGGNETGFAWDVTLTVPDVAGTYEYRIELADVGGLTDEITFTVNVGPTFADVAEVITSSTDHTTLAALLANTGLDATLTGSGPYTVFAPSDAAFGALGSDVVDMLLANDALATQYLTNHVVSGTYFSTDLTDQLSLVSLAGGDLVVSNDGTTISINGAVVEAADLEAPNGIVHSLASVIALPGTPIENTITGVLWNQAGDAGRGALDLDEGLTTGVSSTGDTTPDQAEIRDMGLDCTIPAPGLNWRRQMGAFNGTELRQVDMSQVENFTFDNVTLVEEIQNAFDTGISFGSSDVKNCGTGNVTATVDHVTNPLGVGDMFVILKGTKYYLVRVDAVNETDMDNDDTYEMSIKFGTL